MKIKYFTNNEAFEFIERGRRYGGAITRAQGAQRGSVADVLSVVDTTIDMSSTGIATNQSEKDLRQIKISIRNDAPILLLPMSVSISIKNSENNISSDTDDSYRKKRLTYSKSLNFMLPGESSSIYLESPKKLNSNEIEHISLTFATTSIQSGHNYVGNQGIKKESILFFTVRLVNSAQAGWVSIDQVTSDVASAPFTVNPSEPACISFERSDTSREPSFGMLSFPIPYISDLGQIGEFRILFSPSLDENSGLPYPPNDTQLRTDAYNFLNDVILSHPSSMDNRFVGTITAIASLASTGIKTWTAIRDSVRENKGTPRLSVTVRNLTSSTLYLAKTESSNSSIRNDIIVNIGDTASIPLTVIHNSSHNPGFTLKLFTPEMKNLDIRILTNEFTNQENLLRLIKVNTIILEGSALEKYSSIPSPVENIGANQVNCAFFRLEKDKYNNTYNIHTLGVTNPFKSPELYITIVDRKSD